MVHEIYIPPVIRCCCAWTDLLGFGNLYTKYNWSLSALVADYKKLGQAYYEGYSHFDRLYKLLIMTGMTLDPTYERAIAINDGLARNVDIEGTLINPLALLCWVRETISKHNFYCEYGAKSNSPGVRTTVAIGERTDFGIESLRISQMLRKRVIPDDVVLNSPRYFQNNLAFAKAYLIDSKISEFRKSPPVTNYYVEENFLAYLKGALDKKTFSASNYYTYDDPRPRIESETISFRASFSRLRFKVTGFISGGQRTWLDLKFQKPISIAYRGLNTRILELVEHGEVRLEDFRGPIYSHDQFSGVADS